MTFRAFRHLWFPKPYSVRSRRLVLALTAAFASSIVDPVWAGSDDVTVESPWSRATIGTARPGAAYMIVRNNGDKPANLTSLQSPVAGRAEIHRTSTNSDGVSSMAPTGDIVIAPGTSIALEPGGLHAMLMMLQEPLRKGESFPLALVFSDGGEVTVEVPVLGVGARGPEG